MQSDLQKFEIDSSGRVLPETALSTMRETIYKITAQTKIVA